jgi:hypothetical protein
VPELALKLHDAPDVGAVRADVGLNVGCAGEAGRAKTNFVLTGRLLYGWGILQGTTTVSSGRLR